MRCDLADMADAEALVAAALAHYGQVDIVVNNAGISRVGPALEESLDEFVTTLSVNLIGAFAVARSAAASMIKAKSAGSIVNIASILGLVGNGNLPGAGYAASKGGLVNLTRELGVQWARQGVRVNALCPGFFPTEMTADMFGSERGADWIRRHTPMGRGGREDELDGALLFLCSDASSYVTGSTVLVDGGWTAT